MALAYSLALRISLIAAADSKETAMDFRKAQQVTGFRHHRLRQAAVPIFLINILLPAQGTIAMAAMTRVTLPAGAKVQLELAEQLKSGEAKEGQTVKYFVRGSVIDDKRSVIIKDGAEAFGTVTKSKKKGYFGKKGKLEFTVDYAVAVDGTRISLRSEQKTKGKSGTGNVVGAVIIAGPVGFLLKGGNVVVKTGTMIPAYVDKNTSVKVWRVVPAKTKKK